MIKFEGSAFEAAMFEYEGTAFEREASQDDLFSTKPGVGFESNHISDRALSLTAFLLFFIAVISQWGFGFYAADYYNGATLQQRLEISNQQLALVFNCPTKKI